MNLAKDLQVYLDEQSEAGITSGTLSNRRRHCAAFFDSCSRPGTVGRQDLENYAQSLWLKRESEGTIAFKLGIVLSFCRWLKGRESSVIASDLCKATPGKIVAELKVKYPDRR